MQNDPANCGACGTICPAGQVCGGGKCGVTCLGGSTLCSGKCTVTANDPANCGACGTACTGAANAAAVCANSACNLACNTGFKDCNGKPADGCEINITNDTKNCGSCGNVCAANYACINGACAGAKVAIEDGGFYVDNVRVWLAAQPGIASVTKISACDLATLQQYNTVIVHGNMNCSNDAAFTSYVQGGGGLIGTPWTYNNNGGLTALPLNIVSSINALHSTTLNVTVTDPNDVLLQGVAFKNGDTVGYEQMTFSLKNGATNSVIWGGVASQMVVAKWAFGTGRSAYLDIQYLTSDTAAALGGGNPAVGPYTWAQQLLLNTVQWTAKLK
jgi:hypothetical protein